MRAPLCPNCYPAPMQPLPHGRMTVSKEGVSVHLQQIDGYQCTACGETAFAILSAGRYIRAQQLVDQTLSRLDEFVLCSDNMIAHARHPAAHVIVQSAIPLHAMGH